MLVDHLIKSALKKVAQVLKKNKEWMLAKYKTAQSINGHFPP